MPGDVYCDPIVQGPMGTSGTGSRPEIEDRERFTVDRCTAGAPPWLGLPWAKGRPNDKYGFGREKFFTMVIFATC
jgi:hypothetical protein